MCGIRDTLCRAITKLVMREAGYQAKKACGILQLCAGLEANIEGANHALAQRWRERHVLEPRGRAD